MATAAKCYGIAGVIIDGFVTDLHALTNIGLPVWCKGRSPLTTKRRQKKGQLISQWSVEVSWLLRVTGFWPTKTECSVLLRIYLSEI